MSRLGIGIIGGGYMGKAHAAAYGSVGTLFETTLRPELEMVCATSISSAEKYQNNYGFKSATTDWKEVVNNPNIDAVVIASPQSTHCEIALAAFKNRKHVFCTSYILVIYCFYFYSFSTYLIYRLTSATYFVRIVLILWKK